MLIAAPATTEPPAPAAPAAIVAYRDSGLPPVEQTLHLHRRARALGVTVFFVTRRRESLRAVTRANLRAAGYRGRLRVRLAPNGGTATNHRAFKARERARIQRVGYRIVANVGDQRSDLSGGSARRAFKLPNPLYVTR